MLTFSKRDIVSLSIEAFPRPLTGGLKTGSASKASEQTASNIGWLDPSLMTFQIGAEQIIHYISLHLPTPDRNRRGTDIEKVVGVFVIKSASRILTAQNHSFATLLPRQ